MKAVILAGGLGTRMRPLTNTIPKPLLPLANRAMVDHIIDSLPPDVNEVIMAANYRIEQLREHFREREASGEGPAVRVVDEPEPRGTGGAVKNAREFLDGPFFVFNGDIITSLDLKAMRDFHRERGGIGCLSLWRVEDPSRFGVVRFGDDGRVTSFVEKPQPPPGAGPEPAWINAGVYIFEPEILDHIEPDRKVSSEREVFPKVLELGLNAFPFEGFWVDAGKPGDFLEANRLVLERCAREGRCGVGPDPNGVMLTGSPDALPGEGLKGPLVAGEKCSVGPGSMVGPNVSLGDDVKIGQSALIRGSVVMDGARVCDGAVISGAILGRGCRIGAGASVEEGSVVDHGESVANGARRPASQNTG